MGRPKKTDAEKLAKSGKTETKKKKVPKETKEEALKDCATDEDPETATDRAIIEELKFEPFSVPEDDTQWVPDEDPSALLPLPEPFKTNVERASIWYARSKNVNWRITKEKAKKYAELGDMVTIGDGLCLVDLDKRSIRYYVEGILMNYSLSPMNKRLTQIAGALVVILFFSLIAAFKGSDVTKKDLDAMKVSIDAQTVACKSSTVWPEFGKTSIFASPVSASGQSVKIDNIRKLPE